MLSLGGLELILFAHLITSDAGSFLYSVSNPPPYRQDHPDQQSVLTRPWHITVRMPNVLEKKKKKQNKTKQKKQNYIKFVLNSRMTTLKGVIY